MQVKLHFIGKAKKIYKRVSGVETDGNLTVLGATTLHIITPHYYA